MARPQDIVVLDSWAVLAWFQGEPSAGAVERLLLSGPGRGQLLMTVVNAGEVWYIYARRISEQVADARIGQLKMAGIEIIDTDWELTVQAARYKSRHPIAYADCFAASLARRENARLVTGDPEFRHLESELSIMWI
jgi:ribonuclease VapC